MTESRPRCRTKLKLNRSAKMYYVGVAAIVGTIIIEHTVIMKSKFISDSRVSGILKWRCEGNLLGWVIKHMHVKDWLHTELTANGNSLFMSLQIQITLIFCCLKCLVSAHLPLFLLLLISTDSCLDI